MCCAGEKLEILLDTMSLQIPSGNPQRVEQLIAPQPLVGLEPVLDAGFDQSELMAVLTNHIAENVTLQWPVPRGRVDAYTISWHPVEVCIDQSQYTHIDQSHCRPRRSRGPKPSMVTLAATAAMVWPGKS